MLDLLAAQRYATSLFEIARVTGDDQRVEDELVALSTALKNAPLIEKFFENPARTLEEKKDLLKKLYGAPQTVSAKLLADFFTLVLEKGRFGLVHEIAESYKRIADIAQNEAVVEIRSAVAIEDHAAGSIVSRLEQLTGCAIRAERKVDTSLIGGVVVKFRNRVLDGSARSVLERLKKNLVQNNTL